MGEAMREYSEESEEDEEEVHREEVDPELGREVATEVEHVESLSDSPESTPRDDAKLDEIVVVEEDLETKPEIEPSTPNLADPSLPITPEFSPCPLDPSHPTVLRSLPTVNDSLSLRRRSYNISTSLSHLSKRATICLSTLQANLNYSPKPPSSVCSSPENDADLESKEIEVIEKVLEEDLKKVENEIEEFVVRVKEEEKVKDQPERLRRSWGRSSSTRSETKEDWSWFQDQARNEEFKASTRFVSSMAPELSRGIYHPDQLLSIGES